MLGELTNSDLSSLYLSLEPLVSSGSVPFWAAPLLHNPPVEASSPVGNRLSPLSTAGLESGAECERCLIAWKMSRWPSACCQT